MRFDAVRRRILAIALALAVAVFTVGTSPPVSAAAVAQPGRRPDDVVRDLVRRRAAADRPVRGRPTGRGLPVGSRVARHIHGGPGDITMLDGAMTMGIGADPMRAYAAGELFVEPFRVVAEGANLTPAPASLLVTYLIPVGSAVTTLEGASALPAGQLPPGAAPRFESRMRFEAAPGRYKVGHMLQTYAPGAWSVSEAPKANRLKTVVSGEVTVLTGATQQTYAAGQSWVEATGQAWLSGNLGSGPAVAVREPGQRPGGGGRLDNDASRLIVDRRMGVRE